MILLFTDFGPAGPYLGQMKAVLAGATPATPVIDLLCDAPAFEPQLCAYLLAAYASEFPRDSVFLCVVDPGVGGARAPIIVRADRRWYVGPDNGLFAMVMRHADDAQAWEITWRPDRLSATFHGRDLFAPVAAALARGESPPGQSLSAERIASMPGADWPDDLPRIVYVDHYGNAISGLRTRHLAPEAALHVAGHRFRRAQHFSEVPKGAAFWYENANGLAEIAVNQGSAAQALKLALGDKVQIAEG